MNFYYRQYYQEKEKNFHELNSFLKFFKIEFKKASINLFKLRINYCFVGNIDNSFIINLPMSL